MNDLAFLLRKKPYPLPKEGVRLCENLKSSGNERHEAMRCEGCGTYRPVYEFLFSLFAKPFWGLSIECRRKKRNSS